MEYLPVNMRLREREHRLSVDFFRPSLSMISLFFLSPYPSSSPTVPTILLQSFEEKSQEEVPVSTGDNEYRSEGNPMNEMAHSFRGEEFAVHNVQNTPVARSKLHSRQSSMWPSSMSNGLSLSWSSWFERDDCSSSTPYSSSSSFLPFCGNQSIGSERGISRDSPRYSDPITHKMTSDSGVEGPRSSSSQGQGADDNALRTISGLLWGAVASHVEKLSDTDMQLAGLI
jgi:hypothetical protein